MEQLKLKFIKNFDDTINTVRSNINIYCNTIICDKIAFIVYTRVHDRVTFNIHTKCIHVSSIK